MADSRITALTELTAVDPSDLLAIVDDPSGTPATKKVTVENVQTDWHVGARVYNDANISVNHATWTALTFNQERYDTDAIHDTSSNTDRLTCKTAGTYLIVGGYYFDTNASTNFRHVVIKLNGTTDIGFEQGVPNATAAAAAVVTTIYALSVNDYVTLNVYQDSGGALDIISTGNYSPIFMMQRIG